MAGDATLGFTYSNEEYAVTDIVKSEFSADGENSVSFTFGNYTEEDKDVMAVIALYDADGETKSLVKADIQTDKVGAYGDTVTFEVKAQAASDEMKVFIWDAITLAPIYTIE